MLIRIKFGFTTNCKTMKLLLITSMTALMMYQTGWSQDNFSADNYRRAVDFRWENLNNKKVFNLHIRPNWFPDSTGLWYIQHSPEKKKYLKITFPNLKKADLFDHEKLAKILTDSLEGEIDAKDLPINNITYKQADQLQITVKGKSWLLNTKNYTLTQAPEREKNNPSGQVSPDKKWIAISKDYNLHLVSAETGEVRQLSTAGKKNYEYASWYGWGDIMEGENGDRPEHFNVSWSEDSKWIYANICDLRTAQKMYMLDWSVDTLYRPRLLSYYRGSPGDTGMVYMEPVFYHVETGKEIKPDLPRSTHINQTSVRWSETPGKVYLLWSKRGYQHTKIYTFDLHSEELELLYEETSKTNIDNFTWRLAEKSDRAFFLSEKSGWRQLYSLNLKTKEEKSLTNGTFYINNIARIDEKKRQIYFSASGKEGGRNPYYQHLYSISFEGEKLNLLTPEDLNHTINMSPDGNFFVDNFSTVNTPTSTVLRSAQNGKIRVKMGNALLKDLNDWEPPQIFSATAHDGKTSIYGALWLPSDFDPNKKYPIIDNSYTGPHTQVFPRAFGQAFSGQSLAELGFVVMRVDGLGSSGRSKAFHDYSYKNLGGNLRDHVGAMRQLGSRFSWIDTTRVGIYGHSAGGYDAGHAVLAFPDFYKVAVASSADHDHRMEKAWWPEMYMGWPVDSAYHLQSNITMAGNLKGKLLITHGGIDENVNPSATFKLAEALIKADKQFDMLILPSQRHGYGGKHRYYFTKIRWNYFVEHLLGEEPLWEIEWERQD